MTEAKPLPLSDEEALNKIGLEWLECVNAIIKRSAEIGQPWSQDRAGALIAILAQAGYTFVKYDDLSDDGVTTKAAQDAITSLQAENAEQRKRLEDAEAEVERLRQNQRTVGTVEVCEGCWDETGEAICENCGQENCPIRSQEKK